MKHIFLSIALGVVAFFIYLAIYLGAFRPVEISLETKGPFTAIYKVHRGAYHKIVPAIEEVETYLRDNDIDPCKKSFGQYLDDVAWVEEDRLTSRGGCILEGPPPSEDLPEGFEEMVIPLERYIVAHFTGSPGIGPMKVYPQVKRWAKERNLTLAGPVIEIYEIMGKKKMKTQYLFSLTE